MWFNLTKKQRPIWCDIFFVQMSRHQLDGLSALQNKTKKLSTYWARRETS